VVVKLKNNCRPKQRLDVWAGFQLNQAQRTKWSYYCFYRWNTTPHVAENQNNQKLDQDLNLLPAAYWRAVYWICYGITVRAFIIVKRYIAKNRSLKSRTTVQTEDLRSGEFSFQSKSWPAHG